jgi:hypothetical protein
VENGNYNDYNQNYLQPTPLESVPKAEKKKSKGLIVLKWVGIVLGILVLLVILFLTWFGLETSGTFMRMQDQPKLLRELKEMYDDKSLYVEEYESNSDGIFSVGSFDYTIRSKNEPSIKFKVEYPMSYGIPSADYEDGVIADMDAIRMIYNSSRLSLDGLYSIKKELNSHGLSNVEIFLEILDVNDLEYNYGIGEGYDYGITEGYIYRIFVDKSLDVEDTVKQIVDTLTALDLDDYKIYLSFVDMEEYSRLSDSSENNEFISTNGLRNKRKNKKDVDTSLLYDYSTYSSLTTEDYEIVRKKGHFYVSVDLRRFNIDSFLDESYLNYNTYSNTYSNTPKIEKTYEEKVNNVCHMVIETELKHYFDDKITFYSNPFHIDENTIGDLEYKLYGNNSDSRCQIVIERYFENDGPILDLRSDYAVNFALAEANREIDKLVLKELSDITILPDYISGCVESDDYKSDLVNKEYLRNPIDFQNKYGTDNPIARWLFPEDYDKKQAVKETVEVLEKLGLDRYGVELVFVDDKMKNMLIADFENFEIDESELFSLSENGNILYLTKNIDNITIYYEDVPLDDRMIKDLDSFMVEYVDNSIPYKHKKEMESIMVNENNETIYQNNDDIVNENGEYRFNLD